MNRKLVSTALVFLAVIGFITSAAAQFPTEDWRNSDRGSQGGAVYVDNHGQVWATESQGVVKIDSTGSFQWGFSDIYDPTNGIVADSSNQSYFGSLDLVKQLDESGDDLYGWEQSNVDGTVTDMAKDPNGDIWVTTDNGWVHELDPSDGTILTEFELRFGSPLSSIAIDNDGSHFYTGDDAGVVRKHGSDSGDAEVWTYNTGDYVKAVAVGQNGNIYAGDEGNRLSKIDSSGNLVWENTNAHSSYIEGVAVDNQNNIYTASIDGTVKKFSETGNELDSFSTSDDGFYSIDISEESNGEQYLAAGTGNTNNYLYRWTISLNSPPSANFTYSPSEPVISDSIEFDASSSTDDGTISSYEWDWTSDGNYEGSGQIANHSYSSPGNYTVTLRVTDDAGATDIINKTVTVSEETPPTISNLSPTGVINDRTPTITADASDNFELKNYTLDLDNSQVDSGTLSGTSDSISYTTSQLSYGEHTYNISVCDTSDNCASENQSFTVNEPPTASFTYSPNDPVIGETIQFDGSGSNDPDGSITSYEWDWTSDGTYEATGINPSHSYSGIGDYDVTLRVTDNDGSTDTTQQTVTVGDETPPTITEYEVTGSLRQGDELSVNATVTDNANVDTVQVQVFGTNYSMTEGNNDQYSTTVQVPYTKSTGTYTATVYAEDESQNTESQSQNFEVTERDFKFGTKTVERNTEGVLDYPVPDGTQNITFEIYGGDGAATTETNGGSGGYTEGILTQVGTGDKIVAEVGEQGGASEDAFGGGAYDSSGANQASAGGTHIYLNPDSGTSSGGYDLSDRILVAGGGSTSYGTDEPGKGARVDVGTNNYQLYFGEAGTSSNNGHGAGGYYGGIAGINEAGYGGTAYIDPVIQNGNATAGTDGAVAQGEADDGNVTMEVTRPDSTAPTITDETYTGGETIYNGTDTVSFNASDPETDIVTETVTVEETNKTVGNGGTVSYPESGTYTITYYAENSAGYETSEEVEITVQLSYDELEVDEDRNKYIIEDDRLFKQDTDNQTVWSVDYTDRLEDLSMTEGYLYFLQTNDGGFYGYDQNGNLVNDNADFVHELDADNGVLVDASDSLVTAREVTDDGDTNFLARADEADFSWEAEDIIDLEQKQGSSMGLLMENGDVINLENGDGDETYETSTVVGTDSGAAWLEWDEDNAQWVTNADASTKKHDFVRDSLAWIDGNEWVREDIEGSGNFTEVTRMQKNNTVNDVSVQGLSIYGVTDRGEVFEDQFFNLSEFNTSITSFTAGRDTVTVGATMPYTVEVQDSYPVTSVEVSGTELQEQTTGTYYGVEEMPSAGNLTRTARVFVDGTEVDNQTITVTVVEAEEPPLIDFGDLPLGTLMLVAAALIVLGYIYLKIRNRNKRRNREFMR